MSEDYSESSVKRAYDSLGRRHDESCPPNVDSCDVCPKLCRCIIACEIGKGA